MTEYKICKRCIMDNNGDNTITFDNEGYCNYCTDAINRKKSVYMPNEAGKKYLEGIFAQIKHECRDEKYDCLVGVSGGLDSSYIIYLGSQYGLRMLGVHIDDGLDTELAIRNVKNICEKANVTLINIKPDNEQYNNLTLSFFKASVPNLAIPQDNLILAGLTDAAKKYKIKYILHGSNFAMESILQKNSGYTAADDIHIKAIQKKFSGKSINKLRLLSTFEDSILRKLRKDIKTVKPLNYIEYNFENALKTLKEFSDYEYYGGKHHESVLTRFMQCYYLPVKFNIDKRKSHLSSLIVSGQLSRDEALEIMQTKGYISEELKENDFNFFARFLGISREEFDRILELPSKSHDDYKKSFISSKFVPFIIKCKKYINLNR